MYHVPMTEYASLREKIAAEKAEREERYTHFAEVYAAAQADGLQAGYDVTPTPMYVTGYAPVMDGVCGFAWVNIRPGNSSFAQWLKREGHARTDSYAGGVTIWISAHGQSMSRKQAHADAMAEAFKREFPNLRIYSASRMD